MSLVMTLWDMIMVSLLDFGLVVINVIGAPTGESD